jgi:hypothetical protein
MVIYVLCFGMSVGTVHHFRPYIYSINTINDCGNTCVKMGLVIWDHSLSTLMAVSVYCCPHLFGSLSVFLNPY